MKSNSSFRLEAFVWAYEDVRCSLLVLYLRIFLRHIRNFTGDAVFFAFTGTKPLL